MAERSYRYGVERVRQLLETFYPNLTDNEIQAELEAVEEPKPEDVPLIQAFYREGDFDAVVESLQVGVAAVRHAVDDAMAALPSGSQLRVALQMASLNDGLLGDEP